MANPLDVDVDARDVADGFDDLGRVVGDVVRVVERDGLTAAAKPIVDGAKARAGAFSTRIPGAVRASRAGDTVVVVVDAGKAPHAGPINNRGQSGQFTHPVFGMPGVEAQQQAHPFLEPDGRDLDEADHQVGKVLDDLERKAGFR